MLVIHCSSRKGTEETAMHILAKSRNGLHGGYIHNDAQRGQLHAAADRVIDKQLQQALRGGIGFHHGNLEPQDRATIENLFLHRAIMVCTTHPAHACHAIKIKAR